MASYTNRHRGVVLQLSHAEARALFQLAGDGAEGILSDPVSAHAWIGPAQSVAAAHRALHALAEAVRHRPGKRRRPGNGVAAAPAIASAGSAPPR